MCRKPDIATTMEVSILELASHQVRMSDDRTLKKLFLEKQGGGKSTFCCCGWRKRLLVFSVH
jgi:hypothetical protein